MAASLKARVTALERREGVTAIIWVPDELSDDSEALEQWVDAETRARGISTDTFLPLARWARPGEES